MAERMGDYQEEVLSDLLDLQAELRGESNEPDVVAVSEPVDGDTVTIATSGLEVSVTPSGEAVNARLGALTDRLSRLEARLANVAERIDGVEAQPPPSQPAPEETWRSFLDLQKLVADRLDKR
jgi:hypothetical protein